MSDVFLSAFFTVLYAYLGLVIGFALSRIAPEEMKPGRKYFHIAQIFVMLLLLSFVYFFGLRYIDSSSFLLAFIGMMLGLFEVNVYLFFGIGLIFFSGSLAVIFGVLVFIYGMIAASIDSDKKLLFYNGLYYFVPALILLGETVTRTFVTQYGVPLIFGAFMAYSYKLIFKE